MLAQLLFVSSIGVHLTRTHLDFSQECHALVNDLLDCGVHTPGKWRCDCGASECPIVCFLCDIRTRFCKDCGDKHLKQQPLHSLHEVRPQPKHDDGDRGMEQHPAQDLLLQTHHTEFLTLNSQLQLCPVPNCLGLLKEMETPNGAEGFQHVRVLCLSGWKTARVQLQQCDLCKTPRTPSAQEFGFFCTSMPPPPRIEICDFRPH